MGAPLVVVIDIDGTIIGDILPQVVEWQLVSEYRKECMRQFKCTLIDSLRTSIARPGLAEFVSKLKEEHKTVEFFVFTASEHKWALFIVHCIEASLGFRFNRPIFTRNHMVVDPKTGLYLKSLEKVLPKINRCLKKQGYEKAAVVNDCVLIDNNNTLVPSEQSRLVLCPTYKYTFYQDILRFLHLSTVRENLRTIIPHLKECNMFPIVEKKIDVHSFYAHYYDKLGRNMMSLYRHNTRKDSLWPRLYKAFHKQLANGKAEEGLKASFLKKLNKRLAIR
jgi:hypothetical protein